MIAVKRDKSRFFLCFLAILFLFASLFAHPAFATKLISAEIRVNKTSSPIRFSSPGETITYSYSVTNTGRKTLNNVTVTDSHSGLSAIFCPSTLLLPGQSETCTAFYTTTQADVDAGEIRNTGVASGDPFFGATVTDTSLLTVPAIVSPRINLSKTSSPTSFSTVGQTLTYSYLVTNNGNVTLNNITVLDPHRGLSPIVCPSTSLAPGVSETCTATYTITQADLDNGRIRNAAIASARPPSGLLPISDISILTVPANTTSGISLIKSSSPTSFSGENQTITYSYLVTNTGNVSLNRVDVADHHIGLSRISCPRTALIPGESITCTATYRTNGRDVDSGSITNTASASGNPPTGLPISDNATLTIPFVTLTALRLTKSASPTIFSTSGQVINYSYLITNKSNVTLTNITVNDPHPGLSAISCPSSFLTPNASETCTANYTTTGADVNAGSITNTATASGTPPSGPAIISAPSTAIVNAVASPQITLAKSSSPTSFASPGVLINYSYLVTNKSNATLTNINVTDPHVGLSPIFCPGSSLAPGASETCTATYTTTQADVNAESIQNTSTAKGTPPVGPPLSANSTLSIPAVVNASITLTKSSSLESFTVPGEVITYSYLVTNAGNVTLTNISVTDPHIRLSAISCPTTTLAPAASQTCTATYRTIQADVNAGGITNTGTASGTTLSGSVVTDASTLTVPAIVSPSISLLKSSTPTNFATPGVPITYSYLVTNTGNVPLTSITVVDPHSGLSAISCPTTTLAPAASQTCTATYTTTQADVNAGSIQNTATASGTPPSGPAVIVNSTLTIPAIVNPSVTLTKSAAPTSFSSAGQVITYSYLVKNAGNVPLTNIVVTDPHPGLSAISCTTTTLAPGTSQTCTATYTTTQNDLNAGKLQNTGNVTGTPPSGPAISDSSTLTVPATVTPSIGLTKSSSPSNFSAPGVVINYSYLVTNTGNVTLNNISVTDPHPGLSAISCSSTTLDPGVSQTCTATYTTTQSDVNAGNITNTGTVSGTPPIGTAVIDESSLTVPATVTSGISINKTSSPTSFSSAGELITYSYIVTNIGNTTLSSVAVRDTHVGLSSISCPSTTLAPSVVQTCTATYTTTQADVNAGNISNTGSVSGRTPKGSIVTDSSALTVPAVVLTAVTLTKSASPTSFSSVGQLITYSYLVTNKSNVTLTGIAVNDPHPGLSAIVCPQPSLLPNASETCTATYTTTQADVDEGRITNIATASGTPPVGPVIVSAPSRTIIFGAAVPKITLGKSSSPTNFSSAGVLITYFYLVSNTSHVTLNNIKVTDPHIGLSSISCPVSSLAPGASTTCTANYRSTQLDVNAGSIENTSTVSGTTPTGSVVTSDSTLAIPAIVNPKINLTKSASPTSFSTPGVVIVYSYLVTNEGNVTLANIVVTDPHTGLSPITCPRTVLNPSASTTCTATYRTTQADVNTGNITNTSTATGTPPSKVAVTDSATLTVSAAVTASISINKVSLPTRFSNPGVLITYFYTVRNNGNVPLTNVVVTDPQPGLSPVSCPTTILPPNIAETCTATYTTTQADIEAGSIQNTSTASGTPPIGPAITDNATLTVPADFDPGISLTQSTSPARYSKAGEQITYFYLVTNQSQVTLTNISVTDPHFGLSPVSCPQSSLAPNASETCTATYVTTAADVSARSITSTATASGAPPIGPVATSLPSSLTISFVQANASLTVIKQAVGGNGTFNFNSTITGIGSFVLTTTHGRAQRNFTGLVPGNYSLSEVNLPAGWKLTNLECNGVKINGATANITIKPNANTTCTFTNALELAVQQQTQEKIRTFLNNRAHLILTNEPDRRRIIDRLSQQARLTQTDFSPNVSEGHATLTIVSALNQFLPLIPNTDIWAEAHLAYFNDHLDSRNNHTGQFGLIYLGSDYLFLPSILGGILLEIDMINESTNFENAGKASGTGWLAGPYLSARISQNLYFHTRAAWGGSRNSINPFGLYDDHFSSTRSLYNAELTGNWVMRGLRILPSLGISSYSETQLSYFNEINIFIPSQNIYLGQINFGPEFNYEYLTSRGYLMVPRLRLQGLYYFNQSVYTTNGQVFTPNKFSGLIEVGVEIRLPIGLRLYPLLGYNGFGDNLSSVQGQLQVDMRL